LNTGESEVSNNTNTCPNPSPAMFRELIAVAEGTIAQVKKYQPHWSDEQAANYAIDGVAEAWELSRASEAALRYHFAGVRS
jgi:hypothetical protein